jgi:predicted amidohydrolase
MRIASGQFAAGTDKEANLSAALRLMDEAAKGGAEFIVMPETSLYATAESSTVLAAIAEPLDGPFITAIAKRAAELSIGAMIGTIEKNSDGLPFNASIAIDRTGAIAGTYHKVHLYDALGYVESDGIQPGELTRPFILEYGDLHVGVFTCYDLRFPESARRVMDEGANVLLLPAMWAAGPGKVDTWTTLVRARAIENTTYIVSANQTGPLATGHSLIVDPTGAIIADAGEEPGVIFADIDATRVDEVRVGVPSLANRRFSVVGRI